jgi:hypothetical protein
VRDRSGRWIRFSAWALLGAGAALGGLTLGPLAVVAAAAVALAAARRRALRRPVFGLLPGVGAVLLAVAYVQRDGPGTTCWRTASAAGCDTHLDPRPWLVVGVLLVVAGVAGNARLR